MYKHKTALPIRNQGTGRNSGLYPRDDNQDFVNVASIEHESPLICALLGRDAEWHHDVWLIPLPVIL